MKDVVFGVVASCCVAAVMACYLLYRITRSPSKCSYRPDSKNLALTGENILEKNASPTSVAPAQALRSATAPETSISSQKGLALENVNTLENHAISPQKVVEEEPDFFASFSTMLEDAEHQLQSNFDKALAMIDDLEDYFDNVLLERVNLLETKAKCL